MTTGQRIQQARKHAGLSQKQLGEKLGLSASMIGQWENDLRNPKMETLRRISEALNVPLSEICSKDLLKNYEILNRQSDSHDIVKETADILGQYALALEQEHAIKVLGGKRIERIVYALDKMNDEGQQEAVKRVEELTEIPRYRATPPPQPTPTTSGGSDATPAEPQPESNEDGG